MKSATLATLVLSSLLTVGCVSTSYLESKGSLWVGMTKDELCSAQMTSGALLDTHHVCGWSRRQEYFPELRAELLSTVAGEGHFLFTNVSQKMGALSLGYGDGLLHGWYRTREAALEAVAEIRDLQAEARLTMSSIEGPKSEQVGPGDHVRAQKVSGEADEFRRLRAFLDIFRKPLEFENEGLTMDQEVQYANGDRYSGNLADFRRNGFGVYSFSEAGVSLSGIWKDGKPRKRMAILFEDGSRAEVELERSTIRLLEGTCADGTKPLGSALGVCSAGVLSGLGIEIYSNGMSANIYVGGEKIGAGIQETLSYSDEFHVQVFEGQWKQGDWQSGTLVKTHADGRKFRKTGSWVLTAEGYLLEGLGEVISKNGDLIRGNFKQGEVNGFAVIEEHEVDYAVPGTPAIAKLNRVAEGEWSVDSSSGITGSGKVRYIANGFPLVEYEGDLWNFYPHGRAKAKWIYNGVVANPNPTSQRSSDGLWERGRLVDGRVMLNDGRTIVQENFREVAIEYPDGSKWVGTSVNGVREGFGKYYSENLEIIQEGTFSEGRLHGYGKHHLDDGVIEGTWYHGDLVSDQAIDLNLLNFVDVCKAKGISVLTASFDSCLNQAQEDKDSVDRQLAALEEEISRLKERERKYRRAEAIRMEIEMARLKERRREEAFDQMLGMIKGVVDWKVQSRQQKERSQLANQINDLNQRIRSLQASRAATRLIQQSYPD